MKTFLCGLLALLLVTSAAMATPDITLRVGDPAPALGQVEWIKGEAVSGFEQGHIYVLDFWATWCGPCVQSIPHVNELAQELRADDVTVIGVAIWPNERMVPTADFVAKRGDGMDYVIAGDVDGQTAAAYMTASGQDGIPTAMVIDRTGKIAWIGHPMDGLDDVLEQVVAGTYDVEAAAAAAAEKAAAAAAWEALLSETRPLLEEFQTAVEDEEWADVDRLAGEIAPRHKNFTDILVYRYQAQVHLAPGSSAAHEVGTQLLTGAFADEPRLLSGLAWWIVDPDGELPEGGRDLDLALALAQRADVLTEHADPDVLDTLARVSFVRGDVAKAVELQGLAIELSADNTQMAEYLGKSLAEYRTALDG